MINIPMLLSGLLILSTGAVALAAETNPTTAPQTLLPCAELPRGPLTDTDLVRLVPDGSPGRVRVAWATETQEETYGFNILRADRADGPYTAITPAIVPGEGTTNIPKHYCFEDTSVTRGRVYFYQVEEITNTGRRSIIEGTAATRVKVKSVSEERAWLKRKTSETE